jgi:AbrB family looped-hinge helix DNA binding protein
MDIVKLSSKGNVPIPKSIRDHLALSAGTEFVVSITATGLALTRTEGVKTTSHTLRGILAKPGRTLPAESVLKARLLSALKAEDDASKD